MTPEERSVHDVYPTLLARLMAATQSLASLPLETMGTVADRLILTGTLGAGRQVDPDVVRTHKALIDAAIRYRDDVNAIDATSAEGTR